MPKARPRPPLWPVLLLVCRCALALDPSLDVSQYAHTSWRVRDGFAKGEINAISQTPDGYLWLGTEFGLLRFDGVRAVPWPSNQHVPSTVVLNLLTSRDGTLWIGTEKGLATWRDGQLNTVAELAGQSVTALLEDREGSVWVGTYAIPEGKLCAIRHSGNVCYGNKGRFGDGVFDLYEDSRNTLWAGARTGLWRWKPDPPKFYRFVEAEGIRALGEDDSGRLLIGAGGGVRRFVNSRSEAYPLATGARQFKAHITMLRDHSGGLWIGTADRGIVHVHQGKTDTYTQADNLSGDYVNSIFEDREGSIWVGTRAGLDRFRDFAVATFTTSQGLSNNLVTAVLGSRDGSVWIGSALGGLNRWRNGQVTAFGEPELGVLRTETTTEISKYDGKLNRAAPNALFQDRSGRIWVSTQRGVGYLAGKQFVPIAGIPGGQIPAMADDTAGNFWIAHQDFGLFQLFDGRVVRRIHWTELGHKDPAMALAPDARGGLWLGFLAGGIVYLKDGQVRRSYAPSEGLAEGRVTGFELDPDGTIWVTAQGGLSRLRNTQVTTLTSKDGLPCDLVHGAMRDDEHALWLYMSCGLVRLSASELAGWSVAGSKGKDAKPAIHSAVFDFFDGVRSHTTLNFYSPQVAKSLDGRLWFLPTDGVSVIDPRHLPFNKLPPPLHIEQITANGKIYDAASGLRLPPHIRNLEVDYTALSYVAPQRVRFRYKLEGLDRDWQDVGNRRQAFYTNLPPRLYRFRVVASNNSDVWNEDGASLEFAIAPAYDQTNWFRILCAAGLLALLWGAYQLRIRRLEREEKKLRDVIETMPTFAWTALPDGSTDFANRHWQQYTGLSADRTVGSGWEVAVHPEDLKHHAEKWRASVATGAHFENEVRYRRAADGEYHWFLARAVPLRDARGKILKWYGTATDIEDRKRAEQLQADLAHVDRLTTMGELAASLAHEIKQPIGATVINAQTCLRWLARNQPDLDQIRAAAKSIVDDGKRVGNIIDRLRSLYKKSPPKRELVEVNGIVSEMVVLLRNEASRCAVSICTDLGDNLPSVTADYVQLQQVLMNLMINGIEAMKDTGGVLTVKSQLGQDGRLLVSVSDTGIGLPAKNADQIFNAFFTTKAQGSGMGLAISRSIVEAHAGRLWAAANAERGTTFHFTLPVAAASVKMPAMGT